MDYSHASTRSTASYTHYSPTCDAFPSPEIHDTYFTDQYTTGPDYVIGNYFDNNGSYFSPTSQSLALPPHWSPPPNNFTNTSINTGPAPTNSYSNAWPTPIFNPAYTAASHNSSPAPTYTIVAPHPPSLPTPSDQGSPASPSPSPASPSPDGITFPPPRKRGRLRLTRPLSEGSATTTIRKTSRTQCIPHTQIERKYREKLNMELERLRRAVPLLPQSDAKPSKSMVLAVAIEYIGELERQRDEAMMEVERLGGRVGSKMVGGRRGGADACG